MINDLLKALNAAENTTASSDKIGAATLYLDNGSDGLYIIKLDGTTTSTADIVIHLAGVDLSINTSDGVITQASS